MQSKDPMFACDTTGSDGSFHRSAIDSPANIIRAPRFSAKSHHLGLCISTHVCLLYSLL